MKPSGSRITARAREEDNVVTGSVCQSSILSVLKTVRNSFIKKCYNASPSFLYSLFANASLRSIATLRLRSSHLHASPAIERLPGRSRGPATGREPRSGSRPSCRVPWSTWPHSAEVMNIPSKGRHAHRGGLTGRGYCWACSCCSPSSTPCKFSSWVMQRGHNGVPGLPSLW